ncbi:unnamed protein product, partial [Closterium sp. NIES-53]
VDERAVLKHFDWPEAKSDALREAALPSPLTLPLPHLPSPSPPSLQVDERAVLKHFDWPEAKADALREAAFEFQDLVRLEHDLGSYMDDPDVPTDQALKKMFQVLEKVEQSIYALLRTRDMAISRYAEFGVPTYWILDNGLVGKIRLASVRLARCYITRVTSELDKLGNEPESEPIREFLLLQAVRFAFRTHQ